MRGEVGSQGLWFEAGVYGMSALRVDVGREGPHVRLPQDEAATCAP